MGGIELGLWPSLLFAVETNYLGDPATVRCVLGPRIWWISRRLSPSSDIHSKSQPCLAHKALSLGSSHSSRCTEGVPLRPCACVSTCFHSSQSSVIFSRSSSQVIFSVFFFLPLPEASAPPSWSSCSSSSSSSSSSLSLPSFSPSSSSLAGASSLRTTKAAKPHLRSGECSPSPSVWKNMLKESPSTVTLCSQLPDPSMRQTVFPSPFLTSM
mmetsp:Transcript_6309/g.14604  ORF Transcript_6309/g.14604 Transcript_6309/m.14604 type:complete len:212 (-) Transcript_6309:716-1351(-)